MEPIHVSRLFDISTGLGAKLESAARIVQGRSLAILKKAKDDFRSVIDSGTPSFYIIDVRKDVVAPIMVDYPQINPTELTTLIQNSLRETAFDTSYADFKNTIEAAYIQVEKDLANLSAKQATHLQYRDAFRDLGQNMSKAFRSLDRKDTRGITRISDPETMGQAGKEVYVGKSFDLIQKNLNKSINTTVAKYLDLDKFSYGKYMSAGHTAVKISDKNFGTNTPATQEALFKLEMASRTQEVAFDKFKFQDDFVKQVPLFLEYSVDMTKDFSFAKVLLDINFTFVVPMPASANSASGTVERKAIEKLTDEYIMPSLVDAMKSRLSWLKDVAVNLRSSPNLKEFFEAIGQEALSKGTTKTKQLQDWGKTGKKLIAKVAVPKVTKVKVPTKVAGSTTKGTTKAGDQANKVNLSNLQALLNTHLQDVVSANMGDGSSKNVLNYRTGRFASSVKVERLSQSREGMITAFYNYMRNPYGTFSEGGAQQSPRSRDPKLLISKSIREIAATSVANRLRAVLV